MGEYKEAKTTIANVCPISRARSRNRLAGIGTQRTLCGIQGVEI